MQDTSDDSMDRALTCVACGTKRRNLPAIRAHRKECPDIKAMQEQNAALNRTLLRPPGKP